MSQGPIEQDKTPPNNGVSLADIVVADESRPQVYPEGGSLSIDSAPASATVGTTGTVDVRWSGPLSGTTYLGAVSHTRDAGLVGFTLVNVDTR